MSLPRDPLRLVPAETARIAHAAFPAGNVYMRLRDELGALFDDEQFSAVYASDGQPALHPWQLALVSVMQFAENLSDRQAADAVRARIDWKYAWTPAHRFDPCAGSRARAQPVGIGGRDATRDAECVGDRGAGVAQGAGSAGLVRAVCGADRRLSPAERETGARGVEPAHRG